MELSRVASNQGLTSARPAPSLLPDESNDFSVQLQPGQFESDAHRAAERDRQNNRPG